MDPHKEQEAPTINFLHLFLFSYYYISNLHYMNIFNTVNKAEIHVHLEATITLISVEGLQNVITTSLKNFLVQNTLISGMTYDLSKNMTL